MENGYAESHKRNELRHKKNIYETEKNSKAKVSNQWTREKKLIHLQNYSCRKILKHKNKVSIW